MCNIQQFVWRVEAEVSYSKNNLKYAVIFFLIKGKSNISFGTVKGLLLFVCIHNINIVLV